MAFTVVDLFRLDSASMSAFLYLCMRVGVFAVQANWCVCVCVCVRAYVHVCTCVYACV